MPRSLFPLLKKEILDLLRDPKILIGMIVLPAVLYPVMGTAMKASMSAAGRAALQLPVAILDLDRSKESMLIVSAISQSGRLIEMEGSPNEAIERALNSGAGALVLIPDGFRESLRSGTRASIEVTVFFRGGGFPMQIFSKRLEEAINSASRKLSTHLISLTSEVDPDVVLDPLEPNYKTVFRGETLDVPPMAVVGAIIGQMTTTPMVATLVLAFAMQIAATSMAIEKEEKTLETLLTLPTSRRNILISKLAGSALVAGLGSIGVLGGLWYYLRIVTAMEPIPRGIAVMQLKDIALLALALIVANMLALTLAIIVASFAENVRSAQALVGNLFILIFIPAFMLMFTSIETLPTAARYALKALPFTHLALAVQHLIWREYLNYSISLLYLISWSIGLIFLASMLFSSERILTARIGFRIRR